MKCLSYKLFFLILFIFFSFSVPLFVFADSDYYFMKGATWSYSYSGSVRKDTIVFYPTRNNYYKVNFMFQLTPDQFNSGVILHNPNDLNMSYGVLTSDVDIYSKYSSFNPAGTAQSSFSIVLNGVDQHLSTAGSSFDLTDVNILPGNFYYVYASYNYYDYGKVTSDPYLDIVPAPTPTPTATPTPISSPTPMVSPTPSAPPFPSSSPVPSAFPVPSGIGSASSELGSFDSSGLSVWDMFVNFLNSVRGSGFDLSDDSEYISPAPDLISSHQNEISAYSSDDLMPYSSPSADTSLSDYDFWAFCYDVNWQVGTTASRSAKHRFVPSNMADFSGESSYSYVFTYPVRIPFRITTDFKGVGYIDANFSFSPDYKIFGINGYGMSGGSATVNSLIDISSPWVESSSEVSFNASIGGTYGDSFDVINLPLVNGASPEFYLCFDLYLSATTGQAQVSGLADYMDVTLSNLSWQIITSSKVSDSSAESTLEQIKDNQEKYHQEEEDKANEVVDQVNSGVTEVTDTLSKWQIITMPVTLVTDFASAVASDGSTGLTFPAFSLMGHQLWPSYTFDLNEIKTRFPVLYNGLHLITGVMVVSWFIHYLWRKWYLLIGDDMPEAGAGGGDS